MNAKQFVECWQWLARGLIASALLYSSTGIKAAETNAAVFVPMPREATGARVDEGACRVTLYVDEKGDDGRDGWTARTALKTLGAAVAKAKDSLDKGEGVRVLLAPGVYREGYVLLDGNAMTDTGRNAPLVIEGAAKGQVAINGAVVEGWSSDTWKEAGSREGVRTYEHPWPFDFEIQEEEKPADILISFREMVIFDGQMLKQEASAEKLVAGCFYIDRTNKTISLSLGRELLPSDVIEIAEKTGLLTIRRKNNLVLRNCDFVYCNPHIMGSKGRCLEGDWSRAVEICTHHAPSGVRNTNVLIEDCTFSQNNSTGLGVHDTQDLTIRRCAANRNGWKGIALVRARNALLEDCETSYNAWRQLWSTSRFHDSGGIKIIPNCDTVTLRRFVALENTVTHGIWTDINNSNIILDQCRVEGQSAPAIYFEMGRGPHLIRNCYIKNAQGIVSRGSSNFILENNHLEAENGPLISLIEDTRRIRGGGRPDIVNFVLRDNQFVTGKGRVFNATKNWKLLYNSLRAERNAYDLSRADSARPGFYDRDGNPVSFEQWQKLGFDAGSTCIASRSAAAAP